MSAGIASVTLVSATNPEDGVNVAVAPDTLQLPAIFGVSVGNGVEGESEEENFSVIGAPPLASWVPPVGDTESSRSGAADADEPESDSPALARFSGPEALAEVAANAQPATITAAAVPPVAAIIRCRSTAARIRPTPPKLPKNDTTRSPQRLVTR